jgi:hypothetical protein
MSINRVLVSGEVGQYGVKLTYSAQSKPQASFTLVCEEAGRDGVS